MLSFLNQALFNNGNGSSRAQNNSTDIENDQQHPARRDLQRFYTENEEILRKAESLDTSWAAKQDKAPELEEAVDTFASGADLVVEGLVRLASAHPVLGVAVSAYHSVIAINLPLADGYKKVLLVMLQMQCMMCTMFQLRHLKYNIRMKPGAEKTPLQRLIIAVAMDILQCGSDLNYFLSRITPVKLFFVNTFEKSAMQHIKIFVKRRNELQNLISDSSGLNTGSTSRTNNAITAMGHMLQQADPNLHNFLVQFFCRIRTTAESKAQDLLKADKTKPGAPKKRPFGEYLNVFVGFFDTVDRAEQTGYNITAIPKIIEEGINKKMEPGPQNNLNRFKKFLDIMNRHSDRELARKRLHGNGILPGAVKIAVLGGGIKQVSLGPTVDTEDLEMKYFWDRMNFGTNVEIETFVSNFCDYLVRQRDHSAPQPLVSTSNEPNWISESFKASDYHSLAGALYEPGSLFITIGEAHRFALGRPDGISLASWMAYWASGWQTEIVAYRDEIFSTMRQMHETLDSIHIANTHYAQVYLNASFFVYIDGLFGYIPSIQEDKSISPELLKVVQSISKLQQDKILANLNDVSFVLESPAEVDLVGSFGRIETYILPLLSLILKRHLAIFKVARRVPLKDNELMIHTQSLVSIFRVLYRRMDDLEARFKQAQKDVAGQFKTFAHGMFLHSFLFDPTSGPRLPTNLSTFRIADCPLNHDSTTYIKAEATDLSILEKGPDPFVYDDIDRSILLPSDQRTHPLEGGWNSHVEGGTCHYINIGPIVGNDIIGNGETAGRAIKISGHFESSTETGDMEKQEKSEKSDGYLNVSLRRESISETSKGTALKVLFQGHYDPREEVIRGQWNLKGSQEVNEVALYRRISAADSRHVWLLRGDKSTGVDTSWNLARRRWAFAIETTLSKVQLQMQSSRLVRRGVKERRNWIKVAVYGAGSLISNPEVEDQSLIADSQLFEILESRVPFENARVYGALAEYTHFRMVFYQGGITCDACRHQIKHLRFTCITCRSRTGKGDQVDLCLYCFESPKMREDCTHEHVGSHSLICTSTRFNHFDESEMMRQARILSEAIKKIFREKPVLNSSSKPEGEHQVVMGPVVGVHQPTASSLQCSCCNVNINLPCYSCLTCAVHPLLCLDCHRKEEIIKRDHPCFKIHTRKHHLLLINDSTSVDDPNGA